MWRLDLDSVMRACEDGSYPVQWEQVLYRGPKSPGRISHHRCAVIGDKMVLVGGLKGGEVSNTECWLFDLRTNAWELSPAREDPIDDHSLIQVDKSQLLVFGGFSGGSRVNTVRLANVAGSSVQWSVLR